MPVNVEPTDEYPVPQKVKTQPTKSHSDNLRAKANTAMLLKELDADLGSSTDEEKQEALELFQQIDGTPPDKETQAKQSEAATEPGIALALGGYISYYDQQVIADKIQLRNIAINRLLEMSKDDDQKIAIKAVELIGKASDLFTDHQEITITHKNSAELQEAIRERIKQLMEMNTIDITPKAKKLTKSLDNGPETVNAD
jgi:hypothetical protein